MSVEPKIVAATGHASGNGMKASDVEKAMADAGLRAMEEGVSDPREILKRKLEARENLKANFLGEPKTAAVASVEDVVPAPEPAPVEAHHHRGGKRR